MAQQGEAPKSSEGAIPLPDIKETLKKKEEEEKARIEEEKLKEKRRIKRSDKEAFTRVSSSAHCNGMRPQCAHTVGNKIGLSCSSNNPMQTQMTPFSRKKNTPQ